MTADGSKSALQNLREYYEHEEMVCPACGYEDEAGSWESETNGAIVEYHHECPECGEVREHTVDLTET